MSEGNESISCENYDKEESPTISAVTGILKRIFPQLYVS
jgi:hypothetical protein